MNSEKVSTVGIVILNWNQPEDTCICVESLKEGEIFLVDNGSTDASVAIFRDRFPHVTLIETGENLGYAGGNNVGVAAAMDAGCDFIWILNNDTIIDEGAQNAYLEAAKQFPSVGVFGAKILQMDKRDHLDHFGGNWDAKRADFSFVGWNAKDEGFDEPEAMGYVCGASLFVRSEVIEEVGLFDERFFLFCEEGDFCFRARRAGFGVQTCPGAIVWHKGSASFTGGKPHATYFQMRNRLLWIEKNLNGWERASAMSKRIGRDLFLTLGLVGLRGAKMVIAPKKNRERLRRYRATLMGVTDYFMRRFGEGRSQQLF